MSVKKWNAGLALVTATALLIHAGYMVTAFACLYYNSVVNKVMGMLIAIPIICHAVLSVIIVIFLHDSIKIPYVRFNIRILIQRISGVLMLVMVPLHLHAHERLAPGASAGDFTVARILEACFYLCVFTHVSVSFSSALITLGWLKDTDKKKRIDQAAGCVCSVFYIAVIIFVVMA